MVGEAAIPGASDGSRTRDRKLAEVVPTTPSQDRGEINIDAGSVVATFHLPELEPKDLGYHIGSRTLSLWSRRQGVDFRTILVLPQWVNPHRFVVTHKNGIFEFVMEPHPNPPALPA